MNATGNARVLTLFLTKDEKTFNPLSLRAVLRQRGVLQDVYVVSAEPVNLRRFGFNQENIVVRVRESWSVPLRVAFSLNVALAKLKAKWTRLESYDYLFKVDGDVILPEDYLENLISKRALVAGFGAALLISMKFFRYALGGVYPINECDDGYVLARSIALCGRVARYDGSGEVVIGKVATIPSREISYGVEFYRWGLPLPLLLILPLTRVYLKLTRRMGRHQEKSLTVFLYNAVGYLRATIHKLPRYDFYEKFARMRVLQLYREMKEA